ncbi:MAG: choice-of-anchor Q domain-containing protein [Patescibacteria group bacterium]
MRLKINIFSLLIFIAVIAFSHIWDNKTGRGIQFYDTDPYEIKNISIHDNVIHDIGLHGIALSDHTTAGISIYNNIMYNVGNGTGDGSKGGIGFAWDFVEAAIFNNIFYDIGGDGVFDLNQATSISLKNNISYVNTGQNWYTGDVGFDWNKIVTAINNIWYGSSQLLPSWDTSPITSNPKFVDPVSPTRNFHLQADSPAIDTGTIVSVSKDFDGIIRPQGLAYDIGAYEYVSGAIQTISDTIASSVPTGLAVM